mgnify:CR=1 FL=1
MKKEQIKINNINLQEKWSIEFDKIAYHDTSCEIEAGGKECTCYLSDIKPFIHRQKQESYKQGCVDTAEYWRGEVEKARKEVIEEMKLKV